MFTNTNIASSIAVIISFLGAPCAAGGVLAAGQHEGDRGRAISVS
jgi:hypothetical protein